MAAENGDTAACQHKSSQIIHTSFKETEYCRGSNAGDGCEKADSTVLVRGQFMQEPDG
jgi:hypothetical protein